MEGVQRALPRNFDHFGGVAVLDDVDHGLVIRNLVVQRDHFVKAMLPRHRVFNPLTRAGRDLQTIISCFDAVFQSTRPRGGGT